MHPTQYENVVISHAGCSDGTVAAWIFTISDMRDLYIHFTSERDFHKDAKMPDLTGKNVYIVDYSYPVDVLEHIARYAKSIHLWDHHKTIAEAISKTPPKFEIDLCIDMDRCGAEIVWDQLIGGIRPWFMVHIRDRDLWLWQDKNSKDFSAAMDEVGLIYMQPNDAFGLLNRLYACNEAECAAFYESGHQRITVDNAIIARHCAKASRHMLTLPDRQSVPIIAVGSSFLQSEIGNNLIQTRELMDEIAFIYRYNLYDGTWYVSLRSDNKLGPDVAKIAEQFGGGGHSAAAGFSYRGNLSGLMTN